MVKYQIVDEPFPEGMMSDIEDFFKNEFPKLQRGDDYYDEIFNRPHFFPLQRQTEMAHMMQSARELDPVTIFEIGADKGGGLFHWIMCQPTVEIVIACEIRGTPYAELFEEAFPDIDFLWLGDKCSYDPHTVKLVNKFLGDDKIDCLFIDGDKSAFERDFDAYLPLMNSPSIAFMHDINDRAPTEQFERVKRRGYDTEKFIDTTNAEEAMDRERQGIASASPHEAWLRHWKGASCGVGTIRLYPCPDEEQ